jgi:hypothetical protein
MINIKNIKEEAKKEIIEERTKKAIKLLRTKYAELESAEQIVANIKREVVDLEMSIEDGTAFTGK